jgi:hypothetical protein
MAIHTFGEYLDFHPHLHALVADGLFARSGLFYCLPNVSIEPLEEMFRARVITFLVDKGLLPPATGQHAARLGAFRVQRASEPAGTARRARGP